ncbi:hypothetical protein RIF29_18995 [Crotalaria pallida]|uniref:Uncharacterized protein n=1 Tax=Crotalaria pallida TaxID=3830 RepID=A0AAN9IB05_CROPI
MEYLFLWPLLLNLECSIRSPDYGPLPSGAPAWCQAPFDCEGLLSSTMAIVTCLVGLHYGHVIVHFKHYQKNPRDTSREYYSTAIRETRIKAAPVHATAHWYL